MRAIFDSCYIKGGRDDHCLMDLHGDICAYPHTLSDQTLHCHALLGSTGIGIATIMEPLVVLGGAGLLFLLFIGLVGGILCGIVYALTWGACKLIDKFSS